MSKSSGGVVMGGARALCHGVVTVGGGDQYLFDGESQFAMED